MPHMRDWDSDPPPKDGSTIGVCFRSGEKTAARWTANRADEAAWEVRRTDGSWVLMDYDRGAAPQVWWNNPASDDVGG